MDFDWPAWFKKFEFQIGAFRMQGDQLTAAVKELEGAVTLAVAASQNHTPDTVIAPVIQQISSLAAALKQAFPQPEAQAQP